MTTTIIDAIKSVSYHNGVVRIECLSVGPNRKEEVSGMLLIPGNVIGPVLQGMVSAAQELEKQVKDYQAGVKGPTAGNA